MAQMKRRSWFRRFLASPVGTGLLLVLLFFLIRGVWRLYLQGQLVATKRQETERELTMLTKRQVELATNIQALGTERGLEAKIREDFPVAKEGEGVISILPAPGGATSTTATSSPSWWSRVLSWFKSW
jgi:cell division protein FtsB